MKKLILVFLLGLVFASDFDVSYNPFDVNITDVGDFLFEVNGSLNSVRVVGGPKGRVRLEQVDILDVPSKIEVYRYYTAFKDGYIPNMQVVFAIPKTWLEIKDASYSEIRIFMNDSGKWKNIDKIKQSEDSNKFLVRIEITELGDLVIGIVREAKFCNEPSEWTECIRGNRTRIIEQIVDGVCIPKTEADPCPIQLKASYNTLSTAIALLGLLIIIPLVVYPLVKDRQVF
ncbi:MAG: hypothetical protein GOU98_00460 [Candidatus Altiarchaeota archaeon]|nr:hypothetical protein [Candidatus Altiarchaeota archaeon]